MKFEIGDGYKTRDGRDAGIWEIDEYYIHGWTMDGKKKVSRQWFLNGGSYSCLRDEIDIMPKPEPLREYYVSVGFCGDILGCDKYKNNLTTKYPDCDVFLMREVRDE